MYNVRFFVVVDCIKLSNPIPIIPVQKLSIWIFQRFYETSMSNVDCFVSYV